MAMERWMVKRRRPESMTGSSSTEKMRWIGGSVNPTALVLSSSSMLNSSSAEGFVIISNVTAGKG